MTRGAAIAAATAAAVGVFGVVRYTGAKSAQVRDPWLALRNPFTSYAELRALEGAQAAALSPVPASAWQLKSLTPAILATPGKAVAAFTVMLNKKA